MCYPWASETKIHEAGVELEVLEAQKLELKEWWCSDRGQALLSPSQGLCLPGISTQLSWPQCLLMSRSHRSHPEASPFSCGLVRSPIALRQDPMITYVIWGLREPTAHSDKFALSWSHWCLTVHLDHVFEHFSEVNIIALCCLLKVRLSPMPRQAILMGECACRIGKNAYLW